MRPAPEGRAGQRAGALAPACPDKRARYAAPGPRRERRGWCLCLVVGEGRRAFGPRRVEGGGGQLGCHPSGAERKVMNHDGITDPRRAVDLDPGPGARAPRHWPSRRAPFYYPS
jgi:hypothetical protein